MIDHSSASRFSTGVPDSASRKPASRSNTASERLAAAFLIACASSAITVCHVRAGEPLLRLLQQRVGDDHDVGRGPALVDQCVALALAVERRR